MPKIIIDLSDDINKTLKKYAIDNGRSLKQFLPRYITACVKSSVVTFDSEGEICVIPSYSHANTTANTHTQITATQTAQTVPSQITPYTNAGSINISRIDPASIKDYTKSEQKSVISGPDVSPTPTNERPMPEGLTGSRVDPIPTSKFAPKKLKSTLPVSTDLEIEQVDNEWDAEGNEYSTEDFLFDLKNLEEKMCEDLPPHMDPTKDPDYVALKNYFIKHDLRERFRSLLSDPSRFYPEEGVYEQPQIRYAQAAFRKEKIDEEYIIALLSGTGDTYRATHHMKLYVDEM